MSNAELFLTKNVVRCCFIYISIFLIYIIWLCVKYDLQPYFSSLFYNLFMTKMKCSEKGAKNII